MLDRATGAEYVLHTAALISPPADRVPVATEQVNVGSIQNILAAVAVQSGPDAVRLGSADPSR